MLRVGLYAPRCSGCWGG